MHLRGHSRHGGRSAANSEIFHIPSSRLLKADWLLIAQELGLSPRQLEIVRCLVDGLDEATAADRLGISPHTVHAHMNRLFLKLRVNSRCELVVKALFCVLETANQKRCARRKAARRKRAAS